MPRRPRRKKTANTVVAVCGHVCDPWPTLSRNGVDYVVCDIHDDWKEIAPDTDAMPGQVTLDEPDF